MAFKQEKKTFNIYLQLFGFCVLFVPRTGWQKGAPCVVQKWASRNIIKGH